MTPARKEARERVTRLDHELGIPLVGKQTVIKIAEHLATLPIGLGDKVATLAASLAATSFAIDNAVDDARAMIVVDIASLKTAGDLMRAAADLLDAIATEVTN